MRITLLLLLGLISSISMASDAPPKETPGYILMTNHISSFDGGQVYWAPSTYNLEMVNDIPITVWTEDGTSTPTTIEAVSWNGKPYYGGTAQTVKLRSPGVYTILVKDYHDLTEYTYTINVSDININPLMQGMLLSVDSLESDYVIDDGTLLTIVEGEDMKVRLIDVPSRWIFKKYTINGFDYFPPDVPGEFELKRPGHYQIQFRSDVEGQLFYWEEFTFEFTVDIVAPVTEEELMEDLKVYPNPNSSGVFTLDIESDLISDLEVYSTDGVLLRVPVINQFSIDLSSYGKGVYVLKAVSAGGQINTQKLIYK